MPSGRKNRGSRHRSHKQHQKQKLDESAEYVVEPNLRHGPLPDSDSSPWMMEALPPHVEGPSVLKQDAENVDSFPRAINRKSHQDLQKALHNAMGVQFPSKRKKGAIAVFVDADAATATPSSLDRWDGGESRADETLSFFDSVGAESQLHEFKSSKLDFDNLESLGNGFGSEDFKSESDGKNRKGKGRAGAESGNRAITVIETSGAGQVDAGVVDTSIRIKNKVSRRRDFPELVENEADKFTLDIDCNPPEFFKERGLGSYSVEAAKIESRKGVSAKRWDKDALHRANDGEAQFSYSPDVDANFLDSDRKRGKTGDSGAVSSPMPRWMEDVSNKTRRSESWQKVRKSEDAANSSSRDDAEGLEEQQNAPSDVAQAGAEWVIQNDHRNLELEKELDNRIRRRREESGDRDRWRDDDKERDARKHHYQKEERYKDVSRRKDDKNKEEKHRQDDGRRAEKERSDSRHRDENLKDGRYVEEKSKEEKQKIEKDREERAKDDDKENEEKMKVDRDRDGRSFDWKYRDEKHKDDRHKDEKERDDRPEDKDPRCKEEKPRDIRYRVDKPKEDKHKDDKDQQERFKEDKHKDERLRNEDHLEHLKEDKEWGERSQDENDKRGRQRDKYDKPKDKDKDERSFRLKDEKLKDDKDRPEKHREEFDRDGPRDGKAKYDRKKAEKDQDDGTRIDKSQGERQKIEKQQDLRDRDGTERDDRTRDVMEGDSKLREDRVKDVKSQDHKDKDGRLKDDLGKLVKHDKVMGERDKYVKVKDNKDKLDKQREDKVELLHDETVGSERMKCKNGAVDRQRDVREKDDRQKEGYHDNEKQGGNRKQEEKIIDEKQREARSIELFDVSRDDTKHSNGLNKETRHSDEDRDCSSSHDGLLNQSKDPGEQVRTRSTCEQEARDRKVSERRVSHEATRKGTKVSRDDVHDQDKALPLTTNSGSVDQFKSEQHLKRTRDMGVSNSVIGERDYGSNFRARARTAEGENDFRHDERVLHISREERASPYDAPPHSPSLSLHDGSHFSSYDKSARRKKFDTSVSASSSGGTRRPRERNRHFSEHTDQGKQHYGLEEEVKSWEPRVSNRDMDERRSLSPDRNQDCQSSLTPGGSVASVQEEVSRGPIRGSAFHEGVVLGREHRRFLQGGGPSKARRLDDLSRERSDWSYHNMQVNRPPMGGPMVRPPMAGLTNRLSGPSGLLPPPPPFRPGIDNPAILGTPGNAFEDVSAPREGGRYDRKLGGAFKRSEMQGPGDTWRGGIGMGNWNAQNQGPGPGNMFPPFPQIGAQPSGGFLGIGQQFGVPPLFGPGVGRPSADVGFGGARFHMGDGGVCFPGHGPNHGAAMGWHRPGEPEENFYPHPGPVDNWEGQGPFIDEQQRFGRPEWDQGAQGMAGRGWERGPSHIWQGPVGDAAAGFSSSRFQRETSYQGSLGEEIPASRQDSHNANRKVEMVEDRLLDMGDAEGSDKGFAAPLTDDVMSAVGIPESKESKKARARMQMLWSSVNVSARLAGSDLYQQYLSLLPPSEAKMRELSVPSHRDDVSIESTDQDFEFEPDSEALDLLASSESCFEFLPPLPDTAYKEALELYHKPVRENRVQKSVFGSFLLPVDSSLIKMPSLDVELVNVGDDMETVDEQEHFPCEIVVDRDPFPADDNIAMGFLKSTREYAYEKIEAEEAEQVQDNQELIPVHAAEYVDGQDVVVNSLGDRGGGFTEVSLCIKQECDHGPVIDEDEDMATYTNIAGHQTSSLSINLSLLSKAPILEASVLDNLPERQVQNSDTLCNEEIPVVLNLDDSSSLAAGVTREVDTGVALLVTGPESNCNTHITCTDAYSPVQNVIKIDWSSRSWDDCVDGHAAEHPVASQQLREDLEDKFSEADVVGAATPALAIDDESEELGRTLDTAVVIEIDNVKGNSRPQQSLVLANENTH